MAGYTERLVSNGIDFGQMNFFDTKSLHFGVRNPNPVPLLFSLTLDGHAQVTLQPGLGAAQSVNFDSDDDFPDEEDPDRPRSKAKSAKSQGSIDRLAAVSVVHRLEGLEVSPGGVRRVTVTVLGMDENDEAAMKRIIKADAKNPVSDTLNLLNDTCKQRYRWYGQKSLYPSF